MGKTTRLDNLIAFGEIEQKRRNCVLGSLWIRGADDVVISLELAGNLDGMAASRPFRFRANVSLWDEEPDYEEGNVQLYQQGVVGRCTIDSVTHDAEPLGSEPLSPTESQPKNLLFEWWSQDGHVVMQLNAACVEFEGEYQELEDLIEYDEEPPEGLEDDSVEPGDPDWLYDTDDDETDDDDAEDDETHDDDTSPDLETDKGSWLPIEAAKASDAERTWEEIVQDDSPETAALYQEWDEILHGKNHEPFDWLIDDSVRLSPPHQIRDEAEAKDSLRKLLSRLAPLGIVLDMCEHVSDFEAYQMMIDIFLPGTEIHPRMGACGFIHHFSTWEYCEECNRELEEDGEVEPVDF